MSDETVPARWGFNPPPDGVSVRAWSDPWLSRAAYIDVNGGRDRGQTVCIAGRVMDQFRAAGGGLVSIDWTAVLAAPPGTTLTRGVWAVDEIGPVVFDDEVAGGHDGGPDA